MFPHCGDTTRLKHFGHFIYQWTTRNVKLEATILPSLKMTIFVVTGGHLFLISLHENSWFLFVFLLSFAFSANPEVDDSVWDELGVDAAFRRQKQSLRSLLWLVVYCDIHLCWRNCRVWFHWLSRNTEVGLLIRSSVGNHFWQTDETLFFSPTLQWHHVGVFFCFVLFFS